MFSPPTLHVLPTRHCRRVLAAGLLLIAAMPSRCAGLGKPCPKDCRGCNYGSRRSATHFCTPEFSHSDHFNLTGIYAVRTSKVLSEARGGPDDQLLFDATEIAEGYVCEHFRSAAMSGAAPNSASPKRRPGRPRKTPSPPQRNGEDGPALCTICTGPQRKHLLEKKGRRVGLADQTLSATACDAAQVAHGTYACHNCKKFLDKLARKVAAEVVAQLTPERIETVERVLSAKENWADYMTQSSKEQVDQFNLDMERRLMDFDLPEHPGLWRNFDAYLKMLGCDDGKPTVEQSRRAKIQLAQQGNIFFGTVLGRAGAKSVINGFQRGLAWLVKHGSDETTLRALNKCGIAVAVRTANRMENDAATQWEAALKTTLKPGEDYAGWVDNINAVVFPGFFENRTRTDRHAADFGEAELSDVTPEEAKTSCNCTTKGMCDKSCACFNRLIKCHPNLCSCPCTLLQRVTADLGGGMLSRWVTEKETAIELATDAAVIDTAAVARANPVCPRGVDCKRFRGGVFAILEKLPPAGQRIPPWKRVWVRGDKLIAEAVGLRKRAREAAAKLRTNEWWEMDVDLPIT